MIAADGKKRKIQCANAEGLLRIIQSIPSPKAEPFKRWLAKVGYERLEEIENPELASKRAREIYKAKGYSDDWIEKRMRSIAIRDELTDEWKKRGVRQQIEYAILTAEISKAAFDMTPSQYKKFKNLKREKTDKVEINKNLLNHYKKNINIRNSNPEFQSGNFKVLLINDSNKILCFFQEH